MKKTELAYLAGLFDGEGCIMIIKKYQGGHLFYVVRCQLSITTEFMPILFQSYFGGSIHKSIRGGKTRPLYMWVTASRLAYHFLKAIYPYLKIKKAEAKLAMDLQESIRHITPHHRLSEAELAVREAQYITMKALKKPPTTSPPKGETDAKRT